MKQLADDVSKVFRERDGGVVLPSARPGVVCRGGAAFAQVAFAFQVGGDGGDAGVGAGGVVDAVLDFPSACHITVMIAASSGPSPRAAGVTIGRAAPASALTPGTDKPGQQAGGGRIRAGAAGG